MTSRVPDLIVEAHHQHHQVRLRNDNCLLYGFFFRNLLNNIILCKADGNSLKRVDFFLEIL